MTITSRVTSGIPALPGGELYCHISVDVGGYVHSLLHDSESHSSLGTVPQ